VCAWRDSHPGDSRGDFQIVFVTSASKRWIALRISDHSPQSHSAVIVRHRIVNPRFDDELPALNDSRCRRPRTWCDATAMIYQGMKDKVKNEQAGTIPNAKGSDGKKP